MLKFKKMKLFTKTIFANTAFVCMLILLTALILVPPNVYAQTVVSNNVQIDTGNAGLTTKVAPGEVLPVAIKLLNFGGGAKTDVLVEYSIITNTGEVIYDSSETVAVETTASFVKMIQIPATVLPGNYIAKTFITYPGQTVPATTQFTFKVEQKIFGLFISDFFLFGIGSIATILGILIAILGYSFLKLRRRVRFTPIDYSDIPYDKRTFYEISSDMIMEMRARVGDDAILIADAIEGLKIDKKTGQIISLTDDPAKIISALVSEYEKLLGKKVSFSFRRNEK